MKTHLKQLLNLMAWITVMPLVIPCLIQWRISRSKNAFFDSGAQLVSLLPGKTGVYLRRAYYRSTLDYCSADCKISFGAYFSRPNARVESGVYIGPYAIIGSVALGKDCLVGTRSSLLSGGQLHQRIDGRWSPTDFSQETQLRIGEAAWLGEGVIIMADIGAGAMVAAGAVVSAAVKPNIVVAGNPARFVRTLETPETSAANPSHPASATLSSQEKN